MNYTQDERHHLSHALAMALCVAEKGFEKCQNIPKVQEQYMYEVLQKEHLFTLLLAVCKKKLRRFASWAVDEDLDLKGTNHEDVIDLTYDTDDEDKLPADSMEYPADMPHGQEEQKCGGSPP